MIPSIKQKIELPIKEYIMPVSLCIHGHFYQPPREDPWLGRILVEPSAAPMRDWNERILRESYAPLAWARHLDERRRITELRNCYEWINFNVGPTLTQWLRREKPELLQRMIQGDRKSLARLGHGNAMAQVYHHIIMPLASKRDKILETKWAMDDFRHHFGRDSEGMWLSECAVDSASLEVLAAQGIRFVILAPRQAKAVMHQGQAVPVNEGSLNIGEPYFVRLPSGAAITVVFYHGALSQGIAFEGLLRDGERFWQRIASEAHALSANGGKLLCLATDGETYGHHFTFGEMALAHVLAQAEHNRDGISLTNISAHIAANPPTAEVLLHEPSSWSCVHGVERWRSDCGCMDGGHGGWNQRWRAPLREALDAMRTAADKHFAEAGKNCFSDPEAVLMDYGKVLADPESSDAFAAHWFLKDAAYRDRGWKLLAMQEQALAAYASCAWFFDDIARIEPENAMTFALRAMELMQESGGPVILPQVLSVLAQAVSNQSEAGTGKTIMERDVLPRRDDDATLCLLAWLILDSYSSSLQKGESGVWTWPYASVELIPDGSSVKEDNAHKQYGVAIIKARHEQEGKRYAWRFTLPGHDLLENTPFTSLRDCRIDICGLSEQAGSLPAPGRSAFSSAAVNSAGSRSSRRVGELSHPLREYLLSILLKNREANHRPAQKAQAAHCLSLMEAWTEAQHDLPRPEFWAGLMPYLVLASIFTDYPDTAGRKQLASIFSIYSDPAARALARRMVGEYFLQAMNESGIEDARLAEQARGIKAIMPDMDWWVVQNSLWDAGREQYPLLSRELFFA